MLYIALYSYQNVCNVVYRRDCSLCLLNTYHNLVVLLLTTLVLYLNALLNSTIESIIYNSIKQTKMIVVQFGLAMWGLYYTMALLFSYKAHSVDIIISYLTVKSVLE